MSDPAPVTHSVDRDGIGWITLDDPTNAANVFTPVLQAALKDAIAAIAATPGLRAVVVQSGKEKIFCGGADLKWLAAVADARSATAMAKFGQQLFAQLAALPVPVICAIHGACAGGGFELALACHWRIASDARETRIGLPEVGLGLIPGWGGCVRLPRLVGPTAAAEHILRAALLPAAKARQAGLIDELVSAAEFRTRVKETALRFAGEPVPPRETPPGAAPEFFANQRRAAAERRRGQPAPGAALDAIEQGGPAELVAAFDLEASLFGALAASEIAKNLIHAFLLKESARKTRVDAWFPATPASATAPAPFRTIGIVGAGVMGSGIAQWCAAHGYGVILCDVSKQAIERGVTVIRSLFADAVKRGTFSYEVAHKMTGGIGITTSLEDFEICDLVIEAIVEDVASKQEVIAELTTRVDPTCVIATNTSALPLEELAVRARGPERFVGLHFFNPVGRMPLIEVVLGARTSRETAERALGFVRSLEKSAVVCRSAPGFFVTRVLFTYLNEAAKLWESGVPTGSIDQALRDWGWPMGPMRLIDEVGVDVTEFIFGELQHYFSGRFVRSGACRRLLGAGLLGRKNGSGAGFYSYAGGGEAPNPAANQLAGHTAPALAPAVIVDRLMRAMIEETKRALAEGVVKTPDDADLALLLGAGFPAVRGGLLRYARSRGL